MRPLALGRRAFVGACAAAAALPLAGCGSEAVAPPRPPPLQPLRTEHLGELLPAAGLAWAVRVRPRAIAQVPWLIPAIASFAPEDRLDRFLATTGLDLRQATEAWVCSYDLGRGPSTVSVFRHASDPALIERRFRERLSTNVDRVADREDLVRVGGGVGAVRHVLALLGRDVAILEEGATVKRGMTAVLASRARGLLTDVPGIERTEPLGGLLRRFGDAPVVAVAPGPIEAAPGEGRRSELAELLAVATGAGVAARPTAREGIGLALAVTGAFGDRSADASEALKRAWSRLQKTELGAMLALEQEKEPALATFAPDTAALAVELDTASLFAGLRHVTELDLRAILE